MKLGGSAAADGPTVASANVLKIAGQMARFLDMRFRSLRIVSFYIGSWDERKYVPLLNGVAKLSKMAER
jgi:hypothetical protein